MSHGSNPSALRVGILILWVVVALPAWPASAAVILTDVGQSALPAGASGAAELSGISWAGGDQYYAVSDANQTVYPLTITLNTATGAVTSATLSAGVVMASGTDLEGIAYVPADGSAWIADETGPAVRRHHLATGAELDALTVPAVFANIRANRSFESLSRRAGGAELWTANEEALTADGPVSTTAAGTVVRLQKFDAAGSAAGQWAYVADAIEANLPQVAQEQSGVADLLVLPNGKVLILEREVDLVGMALQFRNRIYEVGFAGATDTSAIAGLDGAAYTPVAKTLLWEKYFPNDDFEGLTLGPKLDDGSFSVLLVSDDGSVNPFFPDQSLYALKISGDVPEPATLALLAVGAAGLIRRRRQS